MAKLKAQEWTDNIRIALTTSWVIRILPWSWSALWRIAEVRGTLSHPRSRLQIYVIIDYIFPSLGLKTDHVRAYVQYFCVRAVRVTVCFAQRALEAV